MKKLETAELWKMFDDPGVTLIDVRSPDAYNGWRLDGEPRGGHIPGARCLPLGWTGYLDWPEVVEAKGLDPSSTVVVYGNSPNDVSEVARRLARLGFQSIYVYDELATSWSQSHELPLERLPRYEQLVPPAWLNRLLSSSSMTRKSKTGLVVCHAFYRDRGSYERGHIPGAVALDTRELESDDGWNRRSPRELEKALSKLGIAHDTTVILYGRCSDPAPDDPFPGASAGQLAAMRCAFILLYAGVRDVRILNGGLQAWCDQGFSTTNEESVAVPSPSFRTRIPSRSRFVVDLEEAKKALGDTDANLICVRSLREYLGEVSGYDYIDKAGRIPGAVFGNCGSDAYHMENYRNPDQTLREYREVAAMWAQAGITPNKQNIFYCGTGWRGSEAFINAWLMGWPRIAVFDGGWLEWSNDPRNPVETGEPVHTFPSTSTRPEERP